MAVTHLTVRDWVSGYLGADEVFRRYGVDFFRIGNMSFWEAAARQGVDADELIADLSELVPNSSPIPMETHLLIAYLEKQYQRQPSCQLLAAIGLASQVERQTASHMACPEGLSNLLRILAQALAEHQAKEQGTLYPAMLQGGANVRHRVLKFELEHDEFSDQLDTIAKLTNEFTAPTDATCAWRSLYKICRRFDSDLRFHMHLENNLLFPRFRDNAVLAS